MENRNQTDSILMTLHRAAIDNAQKKIRSITSPIEGLIETVKFYELAIIQIDASLKIVKEFEDQIPETSRKKMITDLIELKDLLHAHLNNTKCSIIEQDKVLMERLVNEIRLKQALDLKHKELVSLRSKLELDSEPKFESFEVLQDKIMPADDKQTNKHTQQNYTEKARPKEEITTNITSIPKDKDDAPRETSGLENIQIMSAGERVKGEQNVMIEKMKLDIDMFKERFDLTFEQIGQIEARPLDQQWRWLIEKETILIAVKGFIDEQSFEHSKKDAIIARLLEEERQSIMRTMTMEEHYMILLNDCHIEMMNDMQVKLDFELQKIQNEIHVVLKPLLTDFQENVNKKVHTNLLRLDEIKQQVDLTSRQAVLIRNDELVYKNAFARRCENLLLAETEVDLLGDQVEALQDLLQKIYFILEQNSSVLSHNFQVMDIMKMIKRRI